MERIVSLKDFKRRKPARVKKVKVRAFRRTTHLGAASELIASADLLLRGFDVFRAVAAACPCDLVAMKDGALIRIEVKSGLQKPPPDESKLDVLANVIGRDVM